MINMGLYWISFCSMVVSMEPFLPIGKYFTPQLISLQISYLIDSCKWQKSIVSIVRAQAVVKSTKKIFNLWKLRSS